MLRAMLRKDPLTIQVLMKRNREEERKLKKNASMMSLLRNRSKKKYINRTTYLSEEDVTNEKSFNNNDIENSRYDLLDRVIGLDQEVDRLLQFTLDQVLLR